MGSSVRPESKNGIAYSAILAVKTLETITDPVGPHCKLMGTVWHCWDRSYICSGLRYDIAYQKLGIKSLPGLGIKSFQYCCNIIGYGTRENVHTIYHQYNQ